MLGVRAFCFIAMGKQLYFSPWYNFRFCVSEVSLESVGLVLNLQGSVSINLVWNLSQSIRSSWVLMTDAALSEMNGWVTANKCKNIFLGNGKTYFALGTEKQCTVCSIVKKDGPFPARKLGVFKQAKKSIKDKDSQAACFTEFCVSFALDFSGNRNST